MSQYHGANLEPKLSALHKEILVWLILETTQIYTSDDKTRIDELIQKGVPWSAKRFFAEVFQEPLPDNQRGNISRSIQRLAKRGLIVRTDSTRGEGKKRNTTHISLTYKGGMVAAQQFEDPEDYEFYFSYADEVRTRQRGGNG